MRDKSRVGGSDVDQKELLTNGMKIMRVITQVDGAITRALRADQIVIVHLLDTIHASPDDPYIHQESF